MKRHFYLSKLIIFLSLTLVPIGIFGLVTIFYINTQVKKTAMENSRSAIALIEQTIKELNDTLEFYRISVNSDSRIHLALISALNSAEDQALNTAVFNQTMQNLYYSQSTKPYIQSLFLTIEGSPYYINGLTRENFENSADNTWVSDTLGNKENTFFKIRHIKRNKFDEVLVPVVTVYQRLKYQELMAINLYQNYFNKWLDSITDYNGQLLLITDQDGQLLFYNSNMNPEIFSAGLPDSDPALKANYFIASETSNGPYNLSYMSLVPHHEVFRLSNSILRLTLLAGVTSIIVSSILAYVYTARDYRQINQIITLFQDAEKGEFQPQKNSPNKNNAYFHIINNIIQLFMSQTYLKIQLDAKKYALSTAQLSALQYQLNPHFLFNTLQSIDLEILKATHRPGSANHMIADLSELLRYALEAPMKPVTVKEEITVTKSYIQLQSYRLGEDFHIIWDYEEDVLEKTMLRLLLQPIIENSVAHYNPSLHRQLKIKIKIRFKNTLSCTIIDNGPGMEAAKLTLIRENLADNSIENNSRHIGLKNISQRLRLAYPKGTLTVYSKPQIGTIIIINGIEQAD